MQFFNGVDSPFLAGKFGNERKIIHLAYNLYGLCFSPLSRMQMISKRSSGIKLVEEPSFLSIF